MFGSFGQFAATTQFYLYGKSRCTRTGWEKAYKAYPKPDLLENPELNLTNKVYMITGANAGIGREISTFTALKGATVYMICRNPERAEAARVAIVEQSKNEKVHILLGDCGLEADIRRMWNEFREMQTRLYPDLPLRLDALVCNAGALLNHKTLTTEGVEVTFATHLLFGTHLLGQLAIPLLKNTPQARFIAVSSGGMYNTKFPSWDVATATGPTAYDGQYAYAYAKRGQVLLCERWAEEYRDVKFVSCHPGWTQTEAVDAAYGESKKYLEPLRSTWQGAEGIIWLAIAPVDQIQSGGFYLDRAPQVKHIAGPFFTEGSYTKNTPEEVAEMMRNLAIWSVADQRPTAERIAVEVAKKLPLTAMSREIDINAFMGDWHVLGNIPTYPEMGAANGIEHYDFVSDTKGTGLIKVKFTFVPKGSKSLSEAQMCATISNAPINTQWALDPKILGIRLPLGLTYQILDLTDQYTIVGVPDRSYLWIMTRAHPSYDANYKPALEFYNLDLDDPSKNYTEMESTVEPWEREVMVEALRKVRDLGYDTKKVMRVPWIDLEAGETVTTTSTATASAAAKK
jgi:dehydrogenase/reductase SDR family protein 12